MMNKFQKEVIKRRRIVIKAVGLGDWSLRFLTILVRNRLKKDIQEGITTKFK